MQLYIYIEIARTISIFFCHSLLGVCVCYCISFMLMQNVVVVVFFFFCKCSLLANNVNKDVFETFYLKRSSKSSHSSKSSNDSNRYADDMASPPHTKPNAFLTSNSKTHSNFNGNSPLSMRSDKCRPSQYIFGSTYDRNATKEHEPEKENIFKRNHYTTASAVAAAAATVIPTTPTINHRNSGPNSMSDEINSNIDDTDRFKTITINHLRRSFRDSFMDSAKPAKGREHQQLWFIDVNDKREKSATVESHDGFQEPNKVQYRQPKNCDDDDVDVDVDVDNGDIDVAKYGRGGGGVHRVKRNETFRIDSKSVGHNGKNTTISRRETFRINNNQSPEYHSSILIENDHLPNTTKKPIAVTAPYSASNDAADYSHRSPSFSSREYRIDNANSIDRSRYRSDYDPSLSQSNDGRQRSLLDRYDRPGSAAKTVIKIKPPREDEDNSIYDGFTSQKRDLFENRSKLERQSFNDLNSTFDRGRENRSFASLRTKLEKTGLSNRFKFNTNTLDNAGNSSANNFESNTPYRYRPPEAASRPFSETTNTTNRSSFVPYRSGSSNIDRYDSREFQSPNTTINSNRTTISIDYKPKRNNETTIKNSQPMHQHTFSIPLTAPKSPMAVKPKSNKGRSVKFPSVECEVRLISPNGDIKPRRKESWKSKPANDWTFNKVHF